MLSRRSFIYATGATLFGASALSLHAQQFSGAGRLVLGQPEGSLGSTVAERLLPVMSEKASLAYQIQYITQGETRQSLQIVKAARPDGSLILQAIASSVTLLPNIYQSLPFDPIKDFTPLALLGDYSYVLALGPAVPASVRTLDQFVDWTADNPDLRDLGVSLYGSHGHLAALTLAYEKEIAFRVRTYSRSAAIVEDLKDQSLAAAILAIGVAASRNAEGKIRPIVVTGDSRVMQWPTVPSFKELGIDANINSWIGWFVPSGTPSIIVDGIITRIKQVQASREYAEMQRRLLLTQVSLTPAQIKDRIGKEKAFYKALVERYHLEPKVG